VHAHICAKVSSVVIVHGKLCSKMTFEKHCTGWRRSRECLKLQVTFRKRDTNYRALLQKMTYTDKASYGSSPPCSVGVRRVSQENSQENYFVFSRESFLNLKRILSDSKENSVPFSRIFFRILKNISFLFSREFSLNLKRILSQSQENSF